MGDETRIDREAGEAVKRLERQQFLDGKLDKAYAAEGRASCSCPRCSRSSGWSAGC